MATIDTIADRSTGSALAGKAYFETSTNKFIVYNGSAWIEIDSDGTGAVYQNRWGASFDAGDILDVPDISALNGVANASYSFWYKTSTTGTVGLIGGGVGTSAYHWNTGSMLYVHSFVSTLSHGIPIPTLGSWHHVVCTFEAAGSKLYVDGVYKSLVDHGDATASNAFTNFAVGKVPHYNITSGQKSVDAVAFWSATLSDGGGLTIGDTAGGDIAQIYNSGVPKDLTLAASYDTDRTSNLVGYWRMGDDSSDSPVDAGLISGITNTANPGTNDATTVATSQPTFSALASSETIYV